MLTKYFVRLFFISIILSGFSFSQNYNDAIRVAFPGLGPDARALGMGNSFDAVSDNPSASFFNPAGLGLIKYSAFSAGFDFSSFNNDVTFMGNKTNSSTTGTRFNQASFAFPFPTKQGSMVFGMGYFQSKNLIGINEFNGFNNGPTSKIQSLLNTDVPYDLYLTDEFNNTPINGRLNQSGSILNSGSLNNWIFSGAVEVAKNVFIGGNLTVLSGSFESNNDYYEDDTQNFYQGETAAGEPQTVDFRTFYFKNLLKWDVSGWTGKLGMMYQWESFMRLGFTVQFPRIYSIDEEFTVDGSSEFGTGQKYLLDPTKYSDKVKYDIQTPYEFTAAAAFNMAVLIVSAQATVVDYSEMEFKDPEGIDPLEFADRNSEIDRLLRLAYNLNLGAELTVPYVPIKLRAGAIYQQSPFKDDDASFDRKYLTAGVGFLFEGVFGIDIAYAHGWWKDFGDNYGSDVSRTFQDVSEHNLKITTTFRL